MGGELQLRGSGRDRWVSALLAVLFIGLVVAYRSSGQETYVTGAPPGEGAAAQSGVAIDTLCALYGIPQEACPQEWRCPILVAGDLHVVGPQISCPACPGCPLCRTFECGEADLDGDGVVGVPDHTVCSTLKHEDEPTQARMQAACSALVRAWWGQRCQ